jgi:hypothetical protein
MPESRIAQLATSPLLTQFAISASQKAVRPIGNFISPLCNVPDLTFRYKKYTDRNRYKIPNTKRAPGAPATVLGFSADDQTTTLEPNALDFPIPNVNGLSAEGLSYSIMEAQSTLADVSGLALESEIITTAYNALVGTKVSLDFGDDTKDPISDSVGGLDTIILQVILASKNGAPVKVLFGMTAWKKFRNNAKVRGRYLVSVGGGDNVGVVAPGISDVGKLLITNPDTQLSMMVFDDSGGAGLTEDIDFLLDDTVIVFASNSEPNRMDPSFMKTFAPMGGFFKPGSYVSVDERDEVLKMDWTTKPTVTNTAAAVLIDTTT